MGPLDRAITTCGPDPTGRRDALDEDHLGIGIGLAERLRRFVMLAVPPRARVGGSGELEDHKPRRVPCALERFDWRAAHQVAATVGSDRGRRERLVALVGRGVVDGDLTTT